MRKTNTAWRTVKANKTVNFLSNGGTPAPVQQVVAMGGNVSEIEISHEYYTFDGWYTDSVYTEIDKWTLASDKVTSNLNLYAKWYIDVDQELFDPGTYVLRYDGKFVLKEEVEPEDVFKAKEIHIDTLQLVGGGCGGGGAGSGGYDWGQDGTPGGATQLLDGDTTAIFSANGGQLQEKPDHENAGRGRGGIGKNSNWTPCQDLTIKDFDGTNQQYGKPSPLNWGFNNGGQAGGRGGYYASIDPVPGGSGPGGGGGGYIYGSDYNTSNFSVLGTGGGGMCGDVFNISSTNLKISGAAIVVGTGGQGGLGGDSYNDGGNGGAGYAKIAGRVVARFR